VLDLAAPKEMAESAGAPHDRNTDTVPLALRAQALMFGGGAARMQGDYARARAFQEASVALWRSLGDKIGLGQALAGLGLTVSLMGDFARAETVLGECVAVAQASGNPFTVCLALNVRAEVSRLQRQFERAAALLRDGPRCRANCGPRN
jgi:hypothetical protein